MTSDARCVSEGKVDTDLRSEKREEGVHVHLSPEGTLGTCVGKFLRQRAAAFVAGLPKLKHLQTSTLTVAVHRSTRSWIKS